MVVLTTGSASAGPVDGPLVRQFSEVLTFGGHLPVPPPDEPAPPVSPTVAERMRECSAMVVALRLDPEGPPEPDDESLMRIGASVALRGGPTVFLCPDNVVMPRATEHMPLVHRDGRLLHYESTMALVRAFNGMRGAS